MGDSLDMFGDEPEREGEDALDDTLENRPTAAELEAAGQSSMFGAPEPQNPPLSAAPEPEPIAPVAEAPIPAPRRSRRLHPRLLPTHSPIACWRASTGRRPLPN